MDLIYGHTLVMHASKSTMMKMVDSSKFTERCLKELRLSKEMPLTILSKRKQENNASSKALVIPKHRLTKFYASLKIGQTSQLIKHLFGQKSGIQKKHQIVM